MNDTVQHIALTRAIRALEAIGALYAIQYDGETYGTLTLAPPPRERKDGRPHYRRGTTRAHYWPYLEPMQPGDVVAIPFAGFDPVILSRNITAACCHAWGNQQAISQRDDTARVINVLRIG